MASAPPMSGSGSFFCQAILPVLTSIALNVPHCGSPGIATNALPSQSLPRSNGAEWVMYHIGWWRPDTYTISVCGL